MNERVVTGNIPDETMENPPTREDDCSKVGCDHSSPVTCPGFRSALVGFAPSIGYLPDLLRSQRKGLLIHQHVNSTLTTTFI